MNTNREERAARRERRKERRKKLLDTSVDNTGLEESLADNEETEDATQDIAVVAPIIQPTSENVEVAPTNIRERVDAIEKLNPIVGKAEVANTTGIAGNNQKPFVEKLNPIVGKATVANPTGIKTSDISYKPKTLADYISESIQSAKDEKTEALKMQKYYALTDALKTLGQLGGAAVGGAIGGNFLDSAPNVGEHKESKGYLDALERIKKANDRLRAAEEKEYNLAVRDEDRSYRQQEAKLNREWQMTMAEYNRKIAQENAKQNFEASAQLQRELLEKKQAHELKLKELNEKLQLALKQAGKDTVIEQYKLYHPDVPITFNDGTAIDVSETDYKGLSDFYMGKTIGGVKINKDNFHVFLRENPKLVNDYLAVRGRGPKIDNANKAEIKTTSTAAEQTKNTKVPEVEGYSGSPYWYDQWVTKYMNEQANQPTNYVETDATTNLEETKKKYSGYKG